ncbi:uncharacterized protein LY89DRAFT_682355 [Mollisia scopiformis]|uniref:Uncharacterized protein n=1 Tax=Mollisia scopiformis TaxID=149040 RepID=A0A194XKH8_MOLSC|nr:uncharacterized protein LY89DRAFT_682355 [Mollisia scopiformis]KUJ20646.1 hypothetical protein LY89DRAFT_682355 [Mollisia scopiformis]
MGYLFRSVVHDVALHRLKEAAMRPQLTSFGMEREGVRERCGEGTYLSCFLGYSENQQDGYGTRGVSGVPVIVACEWTDRTDGDIGTGEGGWDPFGYAGPRVRCVSEGCWMEGLCCRAVWVPDRQYLDNDISLRCVMLVRRMHTPGSLSSGVQDGKEELIVSRIAFGFHCGMKGWGIKW